MLSQQTPFPFKAEAFRWQPSSGLKENVAWASVLSSASSFLSPISYSVFIPVVLLILEILQTLIEGSDSFHL